jgi:hypothetical protein
MKANSNLLQIHFMPVTTYPSFTVTGAEIDTGIRINENNLITWTATGLVDFGGAFLGSGAPILGPEGDDWAVPFRYPTNLFRKNALLIGVRDRFGVVEWLADGTSRSVRSTHDGILTLAANDRFPLDNSRGWTVTVTVESPDVSPFSSVNLQVGRVEFVQSIQRHDNSVTLVTGKRTLARVFANSGLPDDIRGGVLGPLSGRITLRREGSVQVIDPIGPADARWAGAHNRDLLDHTLNFILPAVPDEGEASVVVEIWHEGYESVPGHFAMFVTAANFQPSPSIGILPIVMHIDTYGGPPSEDAIMERLASMRQRLPYGENDRNFHLLPTLHLNYGFGVGDWPSFRHLLVGIANYAYFPPLPVPSGLEVVRCAFVAASPDFGAAGIAGMAGPRGQLVNPTVLMALSSDFQFDVDTLSHEFGHALGLAHVNCSGTEPRPFDSELPRLIEEPGWFASGNTMLPDGTGSCFSLYKNLQLFFK